MNLRYKIKDIPSEGTTCDLTLARELFADALEGLDPDLDQTSGSAHLSLVKSSHEDVYVSGSLKALVTVPCGACLKPASVLINTPIKMVFTVEDEGGADEPTEPEDDSLDEGDVLHHDGETLDLRPMLREQLILNVPMSVRCKDGCKGLCPVCGGDRNAVECGHKVELGDPRLAALKSLKLE
jgi:uncharacterized protein